jgi:hypothetical protein
MGTMRVDKGGSRTVTPPVQQAPQAVQQGLEAIAVPPAIITVFRDPEAFADHPDRLPLAEPNLRLTQHPDDLLR